MRRAALVGMLALLVGLAGAAPAAAVNLPECGGHFILVGTNDIDFENGPVNLTGNILLTNPTGEVHVGAKNIIKGTITANQIFLGTGAVVDKCVANKIIFAGGTCLDQTQVGPGNFAPSAACLASIPTVNVVDNCVKTAANVTVAAGATLSLAPGCYGLVKVNAGGTLILTAGGTYNVREMSVLHDGTIETDTAGVRANVNVLGKVTTEPGNATLRDLFIQTPSGPGNNVHIGQAGTLDNVVIFSMAGEIHPHTGLAIEGDTELVARRLSIEPIRNEPPPVVLPCVCPLGTHLNTPALCIPD